MVQIRNRWTRADLTGADLTRAENDLRRILDLSFAEVPALLAALREGRVNGQVYRGPCACLVGTIAIARRVDVSNLPEGLRPNSDRPAERWFLAIKEGDTAEKSNVPNVAHGAGAARAGGGVMATADCFDCLFWQEYVDRAASPGVARIGGYHYIIGEEPTERELKGDLWGFGHGGTRFAIRFHDGRAVETRNLWAQGAIPARFRDHLPDNAVFEERPNSKAYRGHGSASYPARAR